MQKDVINLSSLPSYLMCALDIAQTLQKTDYSLSIDELRAAASEINRYDPLITGVGRDKWKTHWNNALAIMRDCGLVAYNGKKIRRITNTPALQGLMDSPDWRQLLVHMCRRKSRTRARTWAAQRQQKNDEIDLSVLKEAIKKLESNGLKSVNMDKLQKTIESIAA